MKRQSKEGHRDNFSEQRYREEDSYLRAKKKLEKIVGFYWHLAAYIIVNTFLIIMIAANNDADESMWNFRSFTTAFFWGIGLCFHFFGVFGKNILFGKQWQEKKIKEFMDKDKQN